jgi:subtilisin family serine protease
MLCFKSANLSIYVLIGVLLICIGIAQRRGPLRVRRPLSGDYNQDGMIVTFDGTCHLTVDQKIAVFQQLYPCIQRRGVPHSFITEDILVVDIVNGDHSCLEKAEIDFSEVCIKSVEYEPIFNVSSTCQTQELATGLPTGYTWSLDKLDKNMDNKYSYLNMGSDARNVDIYIIDTGVQIGHVEFGGRVIALEPAYTQVNAAHGTHVGGTTGGNNYGVSKGMNIYTYTGCRYFYSDGSVGCAGGDIFNGLVAVINNLKITGRRGVVNLSIGGPSSSSSSYDTYFTSLIAAGGIPVVAAGNANVDACTYAPAQSLLAITVGSFGFTGAKSSWSNYGSCVDIWGPGENIPSSIWKNDSYTDKYGLMSGTSMATPHITGLVANLLQQDKTLTFDQVKTQLKANSFDVTSCSSTTCKGAYYTCASTSSSTATTTTKSPTTTTKSPTTTTKSPTTTTKSPTTQAPTTKSPTTQSPTTQAPIEYSPIVTSTDPKQSCCGRNYCQIWSGDLDGCAMARGCYAGVCS